MVGQVTINQTYAKIGIDRMPGKLEIQTQNAQLELHQKHAKVNIHVEHVKVQIDQHDCFSTAGLKSPGEMTAEAAQRGYQQALEFIGKMASDGNSLANIQNGNPIPDIAERDSHTEHEFGYDTIPKARPKFTVTGSVQIDPEPNGAGIHNGVEANYTPGKVSLNFTPTVIKIYMQQYNSISFRYEENKVNTYI